MSIRPLWAALLLAPAPALAAPTVSAAVRHADLDLSSARGRAALDARIARAAARLCGSASATDAGSAGEQRRCRAAARASGAERRALLLAQNAAPAVIAGR